MNLTRVLKNSIQRLCRRFGYEFVTASRTPLVGQLTDLRNALNLESQPLPHSVQWLSNTGVEWHLPWLLNHYEIDCVIDVGANHGQFANGLRRTGYAGRIVSFEPHGDCIQSLRAQAAADPRWEIQPFALGETPGHLLLKRFSDSSFSSLHAPTSFARTRFGSLLQELDQERVEVITLDEKWAALSRPDSSARVLLKTDTQGHDLAVLRGAEQTLASCSAVLCEATLLPLYEGAANALDLFAFFAARGFECSGLYPVSYCEDRPAMIEANVFFINPRKLPPPRA